MLSILKLDTLCVVLNEAVWCEHKLLMSIGWHFDGLRIR